MLGKFDALDRLVQLLLLIAAIVAIANGGFMLADPLEWYVFLPTVITTGPPNAHFIRDIGLAYLGSGLILLYAAAHPVLRWRAALVGGLWLTLHGLLHIYEVLAGICGPAIFWADAPGVVGHPLLVIAALTILFARQRIAPRASRRGCSRAPRTRRPAATAPIWPIWLPRRAMPPKNFSISCPSPRTATPPPPMRFTRRGSARRSPPIAAPAR